MNKKAVERSEDEEMNLLEFFKATADELRELREAIDRLTKEIGITRRTVLGRVDIVAKDFIEYLKEKGLTWVSR